MTVGKIFNAAPNNLDAFNTQAEILNGTVIVEADRVILDEDAPRVILRPEVIHSFEAFNIAVDVSLSSYCDFEVGLAGKQIRWPVDAVASIVNNGGNSTEISLKVAGEARFTELIPVALTGLVKIRITYEGLRWSITILYNGAEYTYSYAYQRPAVNGHTTARFAINNLGTSVVLYKAVIDIPILKGKPLFVGDSITWGSGRVFGSRTFAEQYKANDGRASIFASGSASSGDIVVGFEAIKLLAPSEIYLLIGDNDDYTTPLVFAGNIETILDDWIQAFPANGLPVPTVALMNLTPENVNAGYAALRDVINGFNLSVPHRIIDSWSALARTDNPDLADPVNTVDGVHLSPPGHNKLYAIL